MEPSLENLARATGKQPDELAHLLVCNSCTPTAPCDSNPALIRAALAAYRGHGPSGPAEAPDGTTQPHIRYNRRGEAEVGDVNEFRRIRAEHTSAPIGNPGVVKDPRKK